MHRNEPALLLLALNGVFAAILASYLLDDPRERMTDSQMAWCRGAVFVAAVNTLILAIILVAKAVN